MAAREADLLLPLKATDTDPNDWPEFRITKVKVISCKTGRNVSLLSAHQHNPVKVLGRLEAIDDHLIHLVQDQRYQDKTIEIDHVSTYAFAQYDDGSCGFWAAGRAGWFEIQSPSSSYKTTYGKMNEAASIFYMLADKLKRAHNPHPKMNSKAVLKYAEGVFQDYFQQRKDATYPADVDEARAAFHEHREFLISSMLEGQDGLDWIQTPMLNYFKTTFSDEYEAIEERLRPKTTAKPNTKVAHPVKDSRDSSRKRKSQSPQDEGKENKRRRRKAAQQADVRLQLLPKGLLPKTPQASQSVDMLSSDEDNGNVNVFGHKHKSILQPSGGKYSKKAAARRKGLRNQGRNQDDDEDEHDQSEESPITTLRNAKDLENLTNPPADDSSREGTPSPKFLPRKYIELKVVDYDLPSTEPQGPGDLWTCTFEGCFHRVHEASTAAGKTRMKEHFRTHATQAQEKIDLVLNESRPYLPVNNLMRRLQAFAPSPGSESSPDSLERKFSAPIRRRY